MPLFFNSWGFSPVSPCLGLRPEDVAEVVFPLSSLSGDWEAPSLSLPINYFLPACHLAATSAGSIDIVTVHFQMALKFKLTQIFPR